jgi:hypothetical protein
MAMTAKDNGDLPPVTRNPITNRRQNRPIRNINICSIITPNWQYNKMTGKKQKKE